MTKFLPLFTFLALVFSLNGKTQLSQFSLSPGEVKQEASAIDRILEKAHRKEKIQIPNDLEEGKLVRRLYLSVAGRIPSYDETTAYLANESDRQKSMLIDSLLLSPAYQSQMFNWWADLLRLQSRMREATKSGQVNFSMGQGAGSGNKPRSGSYSLVTAEAIHGKTFRRLLPQGCRHGIGQHVQYHATLSGYANGMRQCHNHPFDKWTQRRYYKMRLHL